MERASAPAAAADTDGAMGNVTDRDTDQASFTALASRPRGLRAGSTGGGGSPATATTGASRSAVRSASSPAAAAAAQDDMPETEEWLCLHARFAGRGEERGTFREPG